MAHAALSAPPRAALAAGDRSPARPPPVLSRPGSPTPARLDPHPAPQGPGPPPPCPPTRVHRAAQQCRPPGPHRGHPRTRPRPRRHVERPGRASGRSSRTASPSSRPPPAGRPSAATISAGRRPGSAGCHAHPATRRPLRLTKPSTLSIAARPSGCRAAATPHFHHARPARRQAHVPAPSTPGRRRPPAAPPPPARPGMQAPVRPPPPTRQPGRVRHRRRQAHTRPRARRIRTAPPHRAAASATSPSRKRPPPARPRPPASRLRRSVRTASAPLPYPQPSDRRARGRARSCRSCERSASPVPATGAPPPAVPPPPQPLAATRRPARPNLPLRLRPSASHWPGGASTVSGPGGAPVTSISIFIRGSASPAAIIVAAGSASPNHARRSGQDGSKSAASGRI